MVIVHLLALGITALAIGSGATAAGAQDQRGDLQNLSGFAVMNGECQRLIVAGKDLSKDSDGKVTNIMYESTERATFIFVTRSGKVVVNFGGMDTPAKGDHAAMALDYVIFTQRGKHRGYLATGTCTYTNPYAGRSYINCSASTKKGLFSASFVSDGKPPGIERF